MNQFRIELDLVNDTLCIWEGDRCLGVVYDQRARKMVALANMAGRLASFVQTLHERCDSPLSGVTDILDEYHATQE